MSHYSSATYRKLRDAFGFEFEIISSNTFEADGEHRTRYTVRRPKGRKLYHAVMLANGVVLA